MDKEGDAIICKKAIRLSPQSNSIQKWICKYIHLAEYILAYPFKYVKIICI